MFESLFIFSLVASFPRRKHQLADGYFRNQWRVKKLSRGGEFSGSCAPKISSLPWTKVSLPGLSKISNSGGRGPGKEKIIDLTFSLPFPGGHSFWFPGRWVDFHKLSRGAAPPPHITRHRGTFHRKHLIYVESVPIIFFIQVRMRQVKNLFLRVFIFEHIFAGKRS